MGRRIVILRWRDIAIGEAFEFDHEGLSSWSGVRGPWRKTSGRTYIRISDGLECRVGSINVGVTRVKESV